MFVSSYLTFVERLLSPFLLILPRPMSMRLLKRPASTSVSGILCPFISCTVCSLTFLDTFFDRRRSRSSSTGGGGEAGEVGDGTSSRRRRRW